MCKWVVNPSPRQVATRLYFAGDWAVSNYEFTVQLPAGRNPARSSFPMPVLDYCRLCGEWLGTVPSHEIVQIPEIGSYHEECYDLWKDEIPHSDWFD